MKITYFTDTFLPWINGVSTSLVTITSMLAEEGHEIQIFAPRPKFMKELKWKANRISLVMLRSVPTFLYPEFRAATPISPRLIMYLRRFNPDIIHFQTTFLVGAGGVLLGKTIRKPIIGTFHTNFMSEEFLKNKFSSPPEILSTILWKYAILFFNQCDAIVAPSSDSSKDLKRYGVKRPVYVIPNTIDESKMKKATENDVNNLKERLHLKKNVLLYVGRVSAEKSLDKLILSFSELIKRRSDVSLVIIGRGPQLDNLQSLVKDLNLAENVVFIGEISPDDLLSKGYFQIADAFVTASTSEVQPVSLIEAMFFGLPIIGVSKRGVGEMVKGIGLISPPDNVMKFAANMERVMRNDTLRKKLSRNSYAAYEKKYSVKKVVKQYEKLYEDVNGSHIRKKNDRRSVFGRYFLSN